MRLRTKFFLLALLTLSLAGFWGMMEARLTDEEAQPYANPEDQWVDSVFSQLSLEQKIGQLFMVAAYSNKGPSHKAHIEHLIEQYHLGGVIFMQGGPGRQVHDVNRYQTTAETPLLVAQDAEWGPAMRLDSVPAFPKQMTLGAIPNDHMVYKMGSRVAKMCKRVGVNVNFAPVVDINSNPHNPVIGVRSFGEIKENVAEKGRAYMEGLQDHGVMANAKHFPGHGDTHHDSHHTLPVVDHSKKRLEELELYPFQQLIDDSLMSIMVAHLSVPALDDTPDKATTLSRKVVTDLLRKEMGFDGLVFTDALNMKGVSKYHGPGEVDLKALMAGNDILLFSGDMPKAVNLIKKALKGGKISPKTLDRKVRKILRYKHRLGLADWQPRSTENLQEDLAGNQTQMLIHELYEKALTVVKNQGGLLPITDRQKAYTSVAFGMQSNSELQQILSNYAQFNHITIPKGKAPSRSLARQIPDTQTVVVSYHRMSNSVKGNFDLEPDAINFIQQLKDQGNKVVALVFGSPYSLEKFRAADAVLCAYEDNYHTRYAAPQVVFGGLAANGRLPVSSGEEYPAGHGIQVQSLQCLSYNPYPESVGMDSDILNGIDEVAGKAIDQRATPGCQVLLAKDGVVIFNKNYGHMTYERNQPIEDDHLYDLASLTKVMGTLQAIMFLYDEGVIDLNRPASDYLHELRGTNKEGLIIKDILAHQAGLFPYIPYWSRTVKTSERLETYYCSQQTDWFTHPVAPNIFAMKTIEDSLWQWTIESRMLRKKRGRNHYSYRYSDLGFYIMKALAERMLDRPIEAFLRERFYEPMGLQHIGYNPLQRGYQPKQIAPTERDRYFRNALIRGYVHDQGAAMMGGVGGHAGLFSNALDLGKLMQMNLQHGYYAGRRFFKDPQTVDHFAKRHFSHNRRGLGWDRPTIKDGHLASRYASMQTFGHTGFTGTSVWADPQHQLVYVFLSNRVHPNANNRKLQHLKTRKHIHNLAYQAIFEGAKKLDQEEKDLKNKG